MSSTSSLVQGGPLLGGGSPPTATTPPCVGGPVGGPGRHPSIAVLDVRSAAGRRYVVAVSAVPLDREDMQVLDALVELASYCCIRWSEQ